MRQSDLIDFLLARIAEWEAIARAATPGPWRSQQLSFGDEGAVYTDAPLDSLPITDESWSEGQRRSIANESAWGDIRSQDADHIALNDPAAVLARCAVDRQIVALHRLYTDQPYRGTPCCQRCTAAGEYPADDAYTDEQNWPCPTLRALASLYADHPDYDESWRP